jgi:hypothetical protein
LLNKINIIEDIILKKEKDLTKVNILFDNIYKYIKEIQSFEKTINIDNILNNIKLFWHNILLNVFPFTTITATNHADIKKNYFETLIKQQETYKGIEFEPFIDSYLNKETDYFVLNLDTIIDTSYSLDSIIDTFQNIYHNKDEILPVDKLMKSIYKIPINDIHELIINLEETFLIEYEETCAIYMNYFKNYKSFTRSEPIQILQLLTLSNMYMKEYISTNNINYNILSTIVRECVNTKIASNFDFTDKNLEKDIELFLKPFKLFINYINKGASDYDSKIDLLSIDHTKKSNTLPHASKKN